MPYFPKIFKTIESRFLEPFQKIQVLMGPRQVGKTTGALLLAQRMKKKGFDVLFISADMPSWKNEQWLFQNWKEARKKITFKKKKVLLIIDEIQKISNWSEIVKTLWDEDQRQKSTLRVFLLGSSALWLQKGLSESLVGRYELSRLLHWSYPEMKQAFKYSLEDWILFGGYPGAHMFRKNESRWKNYLWESLIEPTLNKDLLLWSPIQKPILLRNLLELGAQYSGQVLSFQKVLGQIQEKGHIHTLAHYLRLLDQAMLLKGLEKYSPTPLKRKSSSPKFLVWNMAVLTATSSYSFDFIKNTPNIWGRWIESAVGAHLLNQALLEGGSLLYWRFRNWEVDFVLKWKEKLSAIEIKSGIQKGTFSGLKKFSTTYPFAKTYVIGGVSGIKLENFFSRPWKDWFF